MIAYRWIFVYLMIILSAGKAIAQDSHEKLQEDVFCFYYNWYGNPKHNDHYIHWAHPVMKSGPSDTTTGKIPGGDDLAANFYPALGPYSSTDRATVQRHMEMMRDAGIGVMVVTWWNKNDFTDKSIPMIMEEAARKHIKVAFHIEPFAGRNAQTTRQVVEYIMDTYGVHPAFYRSPKHGNKPFFFLYDSYLTPANEWASLLQPGGRISIRNSRYDAVMIGLWVKKNEEPFFVSSGFDGFYTYFASDGFTYGSTADNWAGLQQWATKQHKIFIPCVGPGYIDTRVRPWNNRNTKDRDGGKYYERMFAKAIQSNAPYIGITSFNEWHEGTQIEPAIPFTDPAFHYLDYSPQSPDHYLKLTKQWLKTFDQSKKGNKQDTIVLRNQFLERKFVMGSDGFFTVGFKNLLSGKEYSRRGSEEFFFTLDQQDVSGAGDHAAFTVVSKTLKRTNDNVQELSVVLQGKPGTATKNIEVNLIYQLYDKLPVVRKQLLITNRSAQPVAITNLDVERLQLEPITQQQTDVYTHYGSHLDRRPYKGNHHDAAVMVYHTYEKEGFILGNEASSVLKRTEVYTHNNRISIGMGTINDHYPFKKWIAPGETFSSPKTFICLIKEKKWEDAFEGPFADFVRNRLGVKLFEKKEIPFAFYNTWYPFRTNVSDTLIRSIANGLEGTGTDLLIIDDGWQANFGDWEAHPEKFPNGLKPACDYIIKKGMRPGLWLALATVSENSKVYKEHPEWVMLDKQGRPAYLHDGRKGVYTMSLASGYYDYILQKIKDLVQENQLAYLKLDFAIANSAYILDYDRKGDYGSKGKMYPDRESSYYAIYENALKLFDALHATFPNLLIDCTYEVWGEYYINDFALLQHADYDWLTNYEADPPEGPINIRQMCYDRARVIPSATNLIGNQLMYTPWYKYTYLSLASGKPILVGDPRTLPTGVKEWYALWNRWFKMMDKKYQFTRFTQTSDVFPRPTLTNWDGVYKFNKEKQGGVLFFYRNGSPESTRNFRMPLVNPETTYQLYLPEEKKIWKKISGKELLEKGITVSIPNMNEAKVLGIEKVQ